jgi:hypothetical protein
LGNDVLRLVVSNPEAFAKTEMLVALNSKPGMHQNLAVRLITTVLDMKDYS